MMSEVPLGAFLSGGVDSSAVVGLMSQLSDKPVKTSCISFSVSQYDESPYAQQMAERFRTGHTRCTRSRPRPSRSSRSSPGTTTSRFADSSAVPTYYVSKTARDAVTVALSGDGGDENFAGYRRYRHDVAENKIRRMLPRFLRRAIFGTAGALYPKGDWLPQFMRGKTFLSNVARDPADAYFFSMSAFKENQKAKLLRSELQQEAGRLRERRDSSATTTTAPRRRTT